jgi:hypothetical protein
MLCRSLPKSLHSRRNSSRYSGDGISLTKLGRQPAAHFSLQPKSDKCAFANG